MLVIKTRQPQGPPSTVQPLPPLQETSALFFMLQ